MLMNIKELGISNIKRIVDAIFGESEHEKRKQSLANAALGVIESASLIVHRIGHGLAAGKDLKSKHAIKQVDRLLSNDNLTVWDSFEKLVPYIIGSRKEIVAAMDWTDFDADKQSMLSINLITTHGRATPMVWKTVHKKNLKSNRNDYEDELLYRLKEVLPEGVKVTILADRGFGDIKLYDYLRRDLGFNFVIRFRGNIAITDVTGEKREAQEWVGKNGRSKTLRNAQVTGQLYEVAVVVCVKSKGMKQAWCIACSDEEQSASELIRWYSKRWGVESQYRDTKNIRFGIGLSGTSIGSVERRDRLLLISALSVIILTLLGAAGEKIGMDRYLKANTVKHRTHSLFTQGCYYYGKLARMAKEEIRKLLDCFSELLLEQKHLQNILWII